MQNEGGNDLLFINLQAARIGMPDLERFKRLKERKLFFNSNFQEIEGVTDR